MNMPSWALSRAPPILPMRARWRLFPPRPKGSSAAKHKWYSEIGLVVACLLLPVGLFIWDVMDTRAAILARGAEEIQARLAVLAEHAHATLETDQLVLGVLDEYNKHRSWDHIEASKDLHSFLDGLVQGHPQIGGLALLDSSGAIRISTFSVPNPPPNFSDRDYFVHLQANDDGMVVGERVHSRVEEGDVLNFARRLSTPDKSFKGVALVNVRPAEAFLNFWGATVPPDTTVVLARTDGRFLARFPHPDIDLTQKRAPKARVAAAVEAPQLFVGASPIDGLQRLFVMRKVNGFPLVIIHGVPLKSILSPWHARVRHDACFFGIAAVALVTLALTVIRNTRRKAKLADDLLAEVMRRGKAETDLEEVLSDIVLRQEADRKRIAQDLHDSLGQHVALLLLNVSAVARAPDDSTLVQGKMEEQKAVATEIGREVSRLAWELRPVWLDGFGLETAIATLANVTGTRSGLDIRLDMDLGGRRFGEAVEATVYRAIQEAITNSLKHAGAQHIDILLDVTGDSLRVTIEDDGIGFDVAPSEHRDLLTSPRSGLGLLGMRERLALVGGSLDIQSAPNEGTAVTLTIPV